MKRITCLFCVVLLSLAVVGTPLLAEDHNRSHDITSTDDHSNWPSGLTATELGYVDGVTSALQTQLDAKAPTANPTFTGIVTIPTGSAGSPSLTFSGDTNTGLFRPSADVLSVASNGSEVVRFLKYASYYSGIIAPAGATDYDGTQLEMTAGDAGSSNGVGKMGGSLCLYGGKPSSGASGYDGGYGGAVDIEAADGGNATSTGNGGHGGDIILYSGIGGYGDGNGKKGGDGGDITIQANTGGIGYDGATNGADGEIHLVCGGEMATVSSSKVTVNTGLDVSTTTGAFTVPRMTTAERNNLTAVNGMIIYNTTTSAFNFYENGSWVTR